MSTTIEIKKAMLSTDKTLVDENNLEIPPNSIIHCLGSLFKVSDTGLRHIVGKKIDNDTYFADSDLYVQLNKLAFVEQSDVTSTPDAAPRKEGLLASAYRFMTAPFLVRTPSNVMTHNKRKKLHDPGSRNCAIFCIVHCINSSELHLQGVALRSQYSDPALEVVTLQ